MNAQQAMKHYKQHRTFYMDAAGHRALYKMIKRQAKIIAQAKCATAEACCQCKRAAYLGEEYTEAKFCPTCHVQGLVQMIKREDERK